LASSEPQLPAGYDVRPATFRDLAGIDALYLASERSFGVHPEPRSGYLRWRWAQPYLDLDRDTRVLVADDRISTFAMSFVEEAAPSLSSCMGRVHPADAGRGLGAWALGFFDQRARAGDGVRTSRLGICEEDAVGHALVAAGGFLRVRTSFDMGVALTGAETPGSLPEGVTIRPFVPGEERTVWRIEVDAFRDHWDHQEDQSFASFMRDWFQDQAHPPSVLLADVDGTPAGLIAWFVDHDVPYIFSVAVLREVRGRGVASSLLRHAIATVAGDGYGEMTLSVDATNPTGAVRVYEKVGMTVRRTLAVYDRDLA